LPEFADLKVLEGFDADSKPQLRDAARVPTIRELLSNTSGYAYSVWNESIHRYEATVKLPVGRERLAALPLAFDPGSRWEYGPSTDVLGILIESLSGLTLEQYFQQKIFAPLGMKDSFFQASADNWPRVAGRSQRGADGRLQPPAAPRPDSPPQVGFFSGGGGLMSTAPDYIRFVRALLNDGELDGARILQPETIDEMARNQIGDHGAAAAMKTINPSLSNDVNIFPGSQNKFGFGFLINSEPVENGRTAGSLMWAGLYNTYFWIDRENGVCGVLLTQILPFADPAVLELLNHFEQSVYEHFVAGAAAGS
jgi:CubicO group peptidase (beta-lactamase class C family)